MFQKKCLPFLLAMLLLVSHSGMAFNLHYCKGKLASISLGITSVESCDMNSNAMVVDAHQETTTAIETAADVADEELKTCCKAKESHESCCKDKKLEAKKITSDDVVIKISSPTIAVGVLPQTLSLYRLPAVFTEEIATDVQVLDLPNHAPPLYKLYCQFIYYA